MSIKNRLNVIQLILKFIIARPKLKYTITKVFSANHTVYVTLLKLANRQGYNFQIPTKNSDWQNHLKGDPDVVKIWDELLNKSRLG